MAGPLTSTAGVLLAALTGVVTEVDSEVIGMLMTEIEMLQHHKDKCQQQMTAIRDKHYPGQMSRLQAMPRVKQRIAILNVNALSSYKQVRGNSF